MHMSESGDDFSKLEWEIIESYSYGDDNYYQVKKIKRAKVYGGWLVGSEHFVGEKSYNNVGIGLSKGAGLGLTFVPDPDYKWLVKAK
ncbi:hypothetical protein DA717_14835 [Piscirickettsiaceae bacterium NZ-RLO2]|nr:hypothetical protein DA717_14835 [Piscirickettsiaceae bacterium NZ-RLO2]